jgi:predicted HicB family RNase H-like nuclease
MVEHLHFSESTAAPRLSGAKNRGPSTKCGYRTMMKPYKGYAAKVTVDEDLRVFHGEVLGIADVVTFQAASFDDLAAAFHESVDDYLAFCQERGEAPDKPYSGRFVLRVAPELHRQASLAAKQADMSLNEWIILVLERALPQESEPRTTSVANRAVLTQ